MNDDYARAVLQAGRDAGITPRGIVIGYATVFVESNWLNYANAKVPGSLDLPHDAVGSDGMSVGLFQQQVIMGNGWWWGPVEVCQDPYKSAALFFARLAKLDYNGPNSPGSYAQAVQQSAYPDRYDQRMNDAQALYDRITGGTVVDPNRPDFNEFPLWSPNCQDRGGVKIDAVFIHTQEGGGGNDAALNLAQFLADPANQVSYHYTISQADDGGVTVVDCVDTDQASWSVLSANNRSINLCFAGSSASWSRAQWLQQSKAIDVAAYVIVADCKKYGIPVNVVAPPYTGRIPGISDHRYVTKILGDGTHTDVGDGFPWDVFLAAAVKYAQGGGAVIGAGGGGGGPSVPAPAFEHPSNDQMLKDVWDQLRGPEGKGWQQLGGLTLVDAVAKLLGSK